MLAALGVSSWLAIPRGEDPPLLVPTFTVVAVYPGASPADIEQLVVRDIEERLDALENVEGDPKPNPGRRGDGHRWSSTSPRIRRRPKYDEVVREINALRPELPAELRRAEGGEGHHARRRDRAGGPGQRDRALPGARRPGGAAGGPARPRCPACARRSGGACPSRGCDVALDLGGSPRLDLPPGRVLQAIGGESADLPGGAVEAGARRSTCAPAGATRRPEEVAATVVGGTRGRAGAGARRGAGELGLRRLHLPRALQRAARRLRHRDPAGGAEHRARARRASGPRWTSSSRAAGGHHAGARLRPGEERRPPALPGSARTSSSRSGWCW